MRREEGTYVGLATNLLIGIVLVGAAGATACGDQGDSTPDALRRRIDAVLPADSNPSADTDGDGVTDGVDNCVDVVNVDQRNEDSDGQGDACDLCPHVPAATKDRDADGVGDVCDPNPCAVGDTLWYDGFTASGTAATERWAVAQGGWDFSGSGSLQIPAAADALLVANGPMRPYGFLDVDFEAVPRGAGDAYLWVTLRASPTVTGAAQSGAECRITISSNDYGLGYTNVGAVMGGVTINAPWATGRKTLRLAVGEPQIPPDGEYTSCTVGTDSLRFQLPGPAGNRAAIGFHNLMGTVHSIAVVSRSEVGQACTP